MKWTLKSDEILKWSVKLVEANEATTNVGTSLRRVRHRAGAKV